MLSRITKSRRRLLLIAGLVAGLLFIYPGPRVIPLAVLLGLGYGLIRLATGPLPWAVAWIRLSIRWKILAAVAIMSGLFFLVSLINFMAMDYMHQRVHEVQEIQLLTPFQAPQALAALNATYHGLLFSLTPLLSLLTALIALSLGVAVALSVINPLRRMGQAMGRIASGDLSARVVVENRDELGELAASINATALDLSKLQEAKLTEERVRALHDRIAQVTLAQEEERRRISRELHDSLGPSLAAIGNRLRSSRLMLRSDPDRVDKELEEVIWSLRGHIREVRELIYDLRPMALDQLGLVPAVTQLLERFSQDTRLSVALSAPEPLHLDPVAEVTIFRVIQECLSNVQKHAKATQVEVLLQTTDKGATVSVRDNGQGFDLQQVAYPSNEGGIGLLSMQERATLLKGQLTVHSSPGRGCQVVMDIPTREAEIGAYTSSTGG